MYLLYGVVEKKRWKFILGYGYHFTNTHGRGYPPEIKPQALRLYTENMGLRSIGRILGVNAATMMHWIRDEGKKLMQQIKRSLLEALDGMDLI
ncbi:MAG: transposase [Alphaproteobacteria bacterium]